ncbi:MAG: metal ABC transporter ATP-binding protein [Actinomycetota bacterium]|nr:metal ABC transporter ATP-binding protein [Actinomycetota bacterium]
MTEPPFELRGGTVMLDSKPALTDVDFRLDPGEFVAVLGDNGAGKSTLVKALLQLVRLTSGTLLVFGKPAPAFREWHRIGYVPQRFTAGAPLPATVLEVVLSGRVGRLPLWRRYGAADREAARKAVEAMGLSSLVRHKVTSLSVGQQQRVLIARALASDPEVLMLDEPASALDADSQDALTRSLSAFRAAGRALLLVAHGLGPLEALLDRVVVLERGAVVYEGPPLLTPGRPHLHVLRAGGSAPSDHTHHHPEQEPKR